MENRGRGRLERRRRPRSARGDRRDRSGLDGQLGGESEEGGRHNPFAHTGTSRSTCGRRTTRIPGPKPVIEALASIFAKKYPNVTIKLKFYDFTSYMKILKLSLNSANAPDVAEGNQGSAWTRCSSRRS